MSSLISTIIAQTDMKQSVVEKIITLLDAGNTIPFIARYRKEMTEGATDEQLRAFHDIYQYAQSLAKRKEEVVRLIDEKGLLTPVLRQQIQQADTLANVENIYRPFKEKKNTKATIAKAKGLVPLAQLLRNATLTKEQFEQEASNYIKKTLDPKTSVFFLDEAIQGAKDIIAEEVADHPKLRDHHKAFLLQRAEWMAKPTKTFDDKGVYKMYGDYRKKFSEIPSYAYLALLRAEKEKQLLLKFVFAQDIVLAKARQMIIPRDARSSKVYLEEAIEDGHKRLLFPSLERALRSEKKRRADEAAIKVFGENMKHLLLTPPVRGKVIMGFDPAYRTGCKIALIDETGKFLDNTVVYPTPPQSKTFEAKKILTDLIEKYHVGLIVIGNGTASRESERFVAQMIKESKVDVQYMVVSEAGASVYSASKLAQEEYPHLDVTVRGAISIAQRVQDALGALTKIDPKAIGVGQYQHDVDQKLLQQKLDEKIEDTVNSVGVNVNTASSTLLQHIAGLTKTTAHNIVAYRDEHGSFETKAQLKNIKGLGPKAYEQCVGFLRIQGGDEPLDATGIHPDHYAVTYTILGQEFGIKKKEVTLPLVL